MKKIYTILAMIGSLIFIQGSLPSHQVYKADGTLSDYEALVKAASEADVVLFGELHDNAIAHWLELELTKSLYNIKKEDFVLGAEMFETDDQLKINEYLGGIISESSFEKECKLWPNYKTDYKPFISFAKENKIPFIATNTPRRYASIVAFKDFKILDTLSNDAKKLIAPLPIPFDPELPGYKEITHQGGGKMKFLPQAQALKDATMGYFIIKNLDKKATFLHFNGSYHSNNFEGICWYLKKYKPNVKILTINVVSQSSVDKVEDENLKTADFIIVVDEDMTKTQ